MLVKMYKHNKRINSTLLPKNEDLLISGNVTLKNATSVDEPIFIMACGANDMPKARICNYVECQGNYFWITELIQLSTTHIEVRCKIDVLTSYRKEILETKAYVMYSSSDGNDQTTDERVSARNDCICETASVSTKDVFLETPEMILEVVNNVGTTFNSPYLLTGAEMEYLKEELISSNFFETFKNYFSNPLENVIHAQLTACNVGSLDKFGSFEEIHVGDYQLSAKGHRFSARHTEYKYKEIKIPWTYNDFRRRSPYTILLLYLPFVGVINLDASMFYNSKTVGIEINIEIITGNVIYRIYADSPKSTEVSILVATYSGNCNSDTPIARVANVNPMQGSISAAIGGAAMAAGNPVFALGALGGMIESFKQQTQINGSISSALSAKMSQSIVLEVWSLKTNSSPDELKEVIGNPLCSTVELGTLSGYCQCSEASVQAIAMPSELTEINNYLNGGVYIE